MNIKNKAYQLKKSGMSYGQIAKELGIGRTTAYDYIKEIKMGLSESPALTQIQKNIDTKSERRLTFDFAKAIRGENFQDSILQEKKKVKEFTGDELIEKQFDSLNFEGKFEQLIGKPSRLFSGIIWGLPKGGKSNFSIRFADYLQEYFGEVVYVAAEEGESVTLQEKIKAIGGSKVTFAENRDKQSIREYLRDKYCDFVFIDSINNAGIDNEFLEILKQENPSKSFISIVQATKGGNFKGDQALTHNCDFIIKVIGGIAYHSGRFNTTTEINIFDEPLHEKNPIDRKKKSHLITDQDIELNKTNQPPLTETISAINEPIEQICDEEYEQLDILSPAFASQRLSEIAKSEQVKLPENKLKKKELLPSIPTKPISTNTILWLIGFAGAASIIDNIMRGAKKQNDVEADKQEKKK